MHVDRNAVAASGWKAAWDITMTRPDRDRDAADPRTPELEASDDHALVAAFLDGRRDAFDVIVGRHQRNIYLLCYRFVGNHEDASDLTQDVFVRAFKGLSKFKHHA